LTERLGEGGRGRKGRRGEGEKGRKGERLIMYETNKFVHNDFILSLLSFILIFTFIFYLDTHYSYLDT